MTTSERPAVRSLHLDVHERPFLVIWETTRACELVCQHCRADAVHHRNPLELSTNEGRRLIDDLAAYGPPRPILVLTGGDPFERDDLATLVQHGTNKGLTVAIAPSVTPKLTPQALAELRDAGASAVSLSLDGATALTHDGFRGVPGVWAATLEACTAVRTAGLRLQINTTVTAANVEELPSVLWQVVDLQAGLWSAFFLVPTGRGSHLPALPAEDVEQVLHWLQDASELVPVKTTEAPHYRRVVLQRTADPSLAVRPIGPMHARLRKATSSLFAERGVSLPAPRHQRTPLDVNAGRGFVFVDHVGNVCPSGFLPSVVGSIRKQPLSVVYRESELLRALRDPAGFSGRCGRCEFRTVCGGSRSRAYATTGDPLGDDPACAHQPT